MTNSTADKRSPANEDPLLIESPTYKLSVLCSEILAVALENISHEASFMDLGGKSDSFQALNLYQRCWEENMRISFPDIFKKSINQLALDLSRQAHHKGSGQVFVHQLPGSQRHSRFLRMPFDYDFTKIFTALQEMGISDPSAIENIYPCSQMQENMYVGQKTKTERVYQTKELFHIRCNGDYRLIHRGWQQIVHRHEVLRTVYVETSDSTHNRLLDAVVLRKKQSDLRVVHCCSVDEVHSKFTKDLAPSTCEMESLYRITVYTAPEKQTFLSIDLNHIAVDESSMVILLDELARALSGDLESDRPAGFGKYIDYILENATEESALDYWIEYLDGVRPCHFPSLTDDRDGQIGTLETVDIDFRRVLALKAFCRRFNVTISNALQFVWTLVLQTYTGESDVCFGYLSSARGVPIRGIEKMVGPVMNLLMCSIKDSSQKSLKEILHTVRDDFVDALRWHSFPIAKVQRILGQAETRLFNTIVTSHYAPSILGGGDDSPIKLLSSHNASDFGVVVKIVYSDTDVRIRLTYSTATLSQSMAKKVAHTFTSIVEKLVGQENLDQWVEDFDPMSVQDLHQIRTWNHNTQVPHDAPTPSCLHTMVERTAQIQPHRPAIHAWDGELSYQALDEAASILARRIVELGVGPGAFVPLHFNKSKMYPIALLGVLKSGNTFVPLDLFNPPIRVREILDQLEIDATSGLIISSKEYENKHSLLSRHLILLDELLFIEKLPNPNNSIRMPIVNPQDPAYVIFTSGSTGTPKGVVIEHGAYSYAAWAHRGGLNISNTSRVLQFASYGFDTSMEDHLTTLIVGGCLCIPSEEERLHDLVGFAKRSEANWAHITPSLANFLSPAQMPTIETMVLGGEPMTSMNVRVWANNERTRLIQVYGPSECCVTSTISPEVSQETSATNIGFALKGCASWIVKHDNPNILCPVGVTGELLMEGPILAREYLKDPTASSSAFVRGLAWAPDKRLYRTRDLVKYDSSGQLHFVGRMDGQVKIRGQRIEIDEVERQLMQEPYVQHCMILAPKSGPLAAALVASVVYQQGPLDLSLDLTPSHTLVFKEGPWQDFVSKMMDFLLDRIPSYMLPDTWLLLDHIPRNTSGKLDRKRIIGHLEEMTDELYRELIQRMDDAASERPGSDHELNLRSIWSNVLGIRETEIQWNTSFFSLGGDSISAMMVSSVARQRKIMISAADILHYRSLERLASSIEHQPTFNSVASSMQTNIELPFRLSPIQKLHFQVSETGDIFDQQTVVVRMTTAVSQDLLIAGFEQLLKAHPMLRARFLHTTETGWTQMIVADPKTRIRVHARDDTEYIIECIKEAKSSLSITEGPLVAIDMFQTSLPLICFTIHHLVVDAVSWRILLGELEDFIKSGVRVPPEPVSFQTWCRAQAEFDAETEFGSDSEMLVTDCDMSLWSMEGKSNCFIDVKSCKFEVDPSTSASLREFCENTDYDMVDIFCTALIISFSDIFRRLPPIYIEGHGRQSFRPGLDPTGIVGWFTTLAPVEVQNYQNTFATLDEVRQFRQNFSLKGLSYFASQLNEKNSLRNRWPVEIIFNYLGAFQQLEKKDALFRRCDGSLQDMINELRLSQRANSQRYSLISVQCVTEEDHISFHVEWNQNMSHQQQLNDWPAHIASTLKDLSIRLTNRNSLPLSLGVEQCELESFVRSAASRLEINQTEIESIYPCSPIQESLILSQLKRSSGYRQRFLFQVLPAPDQVIDTGRLAVAWEAVVQKHAILRTSFAESNEGDFFQVVLKDVLPSIEHFSCLDEEGLSSLWARESEIQVPSPIWYKSLHKLDIIKTSEGSVYCQLSKNHLLTDGVTSRILTRELLDAYDGCLRPEQVSYFEYIKYVYQKVPEEVQEYWTLYLKGISPSIFPRLRGTRPLERPTVDRVSFLMLDKAGLNLSCRNLDLTSSTVFQTAWTIALRAFLNKNDIVFGLLCSGRDIPIPGAQSIVGPMMNLLPMRSHIHAESRVIDVCRQLQGDYTDHLDQQAISLARIQHGNGGGSFFNTILNIQRSAIAIESTERRTRMHLLRVHDTSEYDIALTVTDGSDSFNFTIEFLSDFMSEVQANNLLAVFTAAVDRVTKDFKSLVSHVGLCTELDRIQILDWNSYEHATRHSCIHEIIRETSFQQPLRPAIVSREGQFTYLELEDMATKLAGKLLFLGIGPEDIVALCFEKSLWAVVSMLAVAKSGAAFVHIDPQSPVDRTKAILDQTKSRIGISSSIKHQYLALFINKVLVVERSSVMELPSCTLQSVVSPSNALYVIFTSGTTGTPKGVVIEHRSFCSAVDANRLLLQIEATTRAFQFTNFCFDACLEEIFTVLVAGGCICIPSEVERMSDIAGFVKRVNVNWASLTPSFLSTLEPSDIPSIKFITVHGEPMSQALVSQWAGEIHIRPSYGPTECSVTSTVGAPFSVNSDSRDIGWPVGCQGWVVSPDNHDILMPVGAVGELLIEGPIVGRGYLNDNEQTAMIFIQPPEWNISKDPGRRLYKTGDLVRYAEDGRLLFLGRKDSQVKIRGQRVDLQEIQHRLDACSIVQHGIIIVPQFGILRKSIVAVISLAALRYAHCNTIELVRPETLGRNDWKLVVRNLADIRVMLRKALPDYMMPKTFLVLEKLPVLSSHKIDRRRITQWVEKLDNDSHAAVMYLQNENQQKNGPGSELEESIRKIWGELLGFPSESIDLDESFFQLGGDSILAMQVARSCKKIDLTVTTQDVMASGSVRRLAAIALQSTSSISIFSTPQDDAGILRQSILPYKEDDIEMVVRCSPYQERIYHSFHRQARIPYLYESLVELRSDSGPPLDINTLTKSWELTVNSHSILRTVFVGVNNGTDVFQLVMKPCQSPVKILQAESEADIVRQAQVHLESERYALFSKSPPFSLRIFLTLSGEIYAHLVMAHIVIDHVSLARVFCDWDIFYNRGVPKTTSSSYSRYIQYIKTQNLHQSVDFWTDFLHDLRQCHLGPAKLLTEDAMVGTFDFTIKKETIMQQFCMSVGVTLSNLLQFCWAILLHSYTNTSTVCFGHLISDRDIDISHADDIVGPMLSIMVARATVSDSLLDCLKKLQDDNIRCSFHKVFDLTEVEKNLGFANIGLFNTLINYRKVKYTGGNSSIQYRSVYKHDPYEQHLVLSFNESSSVLDANLTYYKSMFSEATVDEIADRYSQILRTFVNDRSITLARLRGIIGC